MVENEPFDVFSRQIVNDAERILPIMAHGGLVVREVEVNFQNDEKSQTKAFRYLLIPMTRYSYLFTENRPKCDDICPIWAYINNFVDIYTSYLQG
ncbi:MAG TPA: hypothetical protein DEO70_09190 [Bacteroidales bacterium]|nr:MAG: hypothetical protein A2X11_15430 [Bacteroidetes bacterium GWE2_42_24]HBZ67000.1 hypothetical protein [Bacteroidales bacterium]